VIWKICKKPRAIRIPAKRNRGEQAWNSEIAAPNIAIIMPAIAKAPCKKPGAVFRPGSIKVPDYTFSYESRNKSNDIFTLEIFTPPCSDAKNFNVK
jgi:hypothetical protein